MTKLVITLVNFSPIKVINDERYQKWMSQFNEMVTHFVCNNESPTNSFIAANKLQIQFNLI